MLQRWQINRVLADILVVGLTSSVILGIGPR